MTIADFHWIQPDLAVGGVGPSASAVPFAAPHGFGAVVDLRAEVATGAAPPASLGPKLLHLPTPDRIGPSQHDLDRGVAFIAGCAAEGRHVLIHCYHGVGRSACLALCVLADRGVAPLTALALTKQRRAAVSPSRPQFDAWCLWLARRTRFAAPNWYDFGVIAYRS